MTEPAEVSLVQDQCVDKELPTAADVTESTGPTVLQEEPVPQESGLARMRQSLASIAANVKEAAVQLHQQARESWDDVTMLCPDCSTVLQVPSGNAKIFACVNCGVHINMPGVGTRISHQISKGTDKLGGSVQDAFGRTVPVQVTVPDDAGPGTTVWVEGPNGTVSNVHIPYGLAPGETFIAQLPASVALEKTVLHGAEKALEEIPVIEPMSASEVSQITRANSADGLEEMISEIPAADDATDESLPATSATAVAASDDSVPAASAEPPTAEGASDEPGAATSADTSDAASTPDEAGGAEVADAGPAAETASDTSAEIESRRERIQKKLSVFGTDVKLKAEAAQVVAERKTKEAAEQWHDVPVQCPSCGSMLKVPVDVTIVECGKCHGKVNNVGHDARARFHLTRFSKRITGVVQDVLGETFPVKVLLPEGTQGGQTIPVLAGPGGQIVMVLVPEGLQPGQEFVATIAKSKFAQEAPAAFTQAAPSAAPVAQRATVNVTSRAGYTAPDQVAPTPTAVQSPAVAERSDVSPTVGSSQVAAAAPAAETSVSGQSIAKPSPAVEESVNTSEATKPLADKDEHAPVPAAAPVQRY